MLYFPTALASDCLSRYHHKQLWEHFNRSSEQDFPTGRNWGNYALADHFIFPDFERSVPHETICIAKKFCIWSFCNHLMQLYTLWTICCDIFNMYGKIIETHFLNLSQYSEQQGKTQSVKYCRNTCVFLHTVASVYCRYEVDLYIFLWRTVTVAVLVWPHPETSASVVCSCPRKN